jgi:hypothetical protein
VQQWAIKKARKSEKGKGARAPDTPSRTERAAQGVYERKKRPL